MDNSRVFATVVIVLIIALLSFFQMQLRGYEKVSRMEEWVLYVEEPNNCVSVLELIYSDDEFNYYLTCNNSSSYMLKSGFTEKELTNAIEENLISINDLEQLIDIYIESKWNLRGERHYGI